MGWSDSLLSPSSPEPEKKKSYADDLLAPPAMNLDNPRITGTSPPFGPPDLEQQAAAQFGEPDKPSRSLIDMLTGRDKRTPATDSAPEIGSLMGGPGTNARMTLGMLTASDPRQMADIVKANYPDATFDTDEKGNVFVTTGGKRFQMDKPGPTDQDVLAGAAEVASYLPAARLGAMPKTGMGKVVASATGAAATSVARDMGASAAGSQQGVNIPRAAFSALGEAALPAGSAVTKKIFGRNVPMQPGEITPDMITGTTEAGKASGIDLFPAQRTGLEDQLIKQRLVSQLPGGAQISAAALKKQNAQAYDAVMRFIDGIAPPGATATGPARFRSAAEKLNDSIKTARAERASPLYESAFREGAKIDVSPVLEMGKGIVSEYPAGGKIASPVARAVKMINAAGGDLKKLHNVKTEIDQIIATGVASSNSSPLQGTAKRELVRIQDALLEAMDNASPTYAQARKMFRENSGIIDEVGQSVVGQAAGVKDTNLKDLSGKIFDPKETNPEVIKRTRELIDSVDPGAYDELLRVEMEKRIGSMKVSQEGVQNVPGQIWRSVFGNESQRRSLYGALRPEQRSVAQQLELALQAASKGRAPGSPTIAYNEAKQEMMSGPVSVLRQWISSPMKAASQMGEEAWVRRKANAIAKVMYDPAFNKDVDAALKMMRFDVNSGSQQLYRILQSAMGAEAGNATEDM